MVEELTCERIGEKLFCSFKNKGEEIHFQVKIKDNIIEFEGNKNLIKNSVIEKLLDNTYLEPPKIKKIQIFL